VNSNKSGAYSVPLKGERKMPISLFNKGDSGTIAKILGKDAARTHLESLGFTTGTRVTVVSRLSGSMIIEIKGCRVALDETMARRIIVG
jgi:Fe2+ transport system protein A